jgi:trigger factor
MPALNKKRVGSLPLDTSSDRELDTRVLVPTTECERRYGVSSSYKMLKPVLAELSVIVPKEDVTKAINKAYAGLSKKARVRGFRKGKAPRSVLQRLYGEAVLQDVRSELINTHLLKSLLDNELDPLSQPQLDVPDLKNETDYEFKAIFEVRPRVEKIDYSNVEIERLRVSVSEADINAELERIRGTLASVSDLAEPRPAAKGDVAILSLKRWEDGEWKENQGMPEQEVIIGEGQAPAQIDEALVGMNIDEEKVVDMGSATNMEENRMRFLVCLKTLKERKLPDVDDEMAKDTGKYDSLEALKADIEKHILEGRNRQEEQRMRYALFKKLMEKNPMTLPPSLVDRHAQAMKNQFFGQVMSQMKEEESEEMLKGLEEGTRKSAEEMVHQHLLTMEIARLEGIKVEDEDFEKEIEERATAAGIPVPMLKAELNKERKREELSVEILKRKIFDFAKSSVKIIEVDELSEPKTEEEKSDAAPVIKTENGSERMVDESSGAAEGAEEADDNSAVNDAEIDAVKTDKTGKKQGAEEKTAAKNSAEKQTVADSPAIDETEKAKAAEQEQ